MSYGRKNGHATTWSGRASYDGSPFGESPFRPKKTTFTIMHDGTIPLRLARLPAFVSDHRMCRRIWTQQCGSNKETASIDQGQTEETEMSCHSTQLPKHGFQNERLFWRTHGTHKQLKRTQFGVIHSVHTMLQDAASSPAPNHRKLFPHEGGTLIVRLLFR